MKSAKNLIATVVALLLRPDLWLSTVRLFLRLIPSRIRPWPSREYLDYRGRAVYGMPLLQIPPSDFIRYVEWCKAFPGPVY